MSYCRNYENDDRPYIDAEYAAEDSRPVLCVCEQCGGDIHGANTGYEGDDIIELPDGTIHYDCVLDWARENKREAV